MTKTNGTDSKRKGSGSGKKRPRNNHGTKRKRPPKRAEAIVFDPEARKEYLQGFSQRKQQRRAYGLAMQKVKDRKAKLEHRAELKSAEMEQIEEAEARKEQLLLESMQLPSNDLEEDKKSKKKTDVFNREEAKEPLETTVQSYHDVQTQQQVIVTTSTSIPGDSDDEIEPVARKISHDHRQEYAGNVERFLKGMKGSLPSKKKNKTDTSTKRRGKHGASTMKGVGSASDLKTAQKVLARTKNKGGKQQGGSKKRKR